MFSFRKLVVLLPKEKVFSPPRESSLCTSFITSCIKFTAFWQRCKTLLSTQNPPWRRRWARANKYVIFTVFWINQLINQSIVRSIDRSIDNFTIVYRLLSNHSCYRHSLSPLKAAVFIFWMNLRSAWRIPTLGRSWTTSGYSKSHDDSICSVLSTYHYRVKNCGLNELSKTTFTTRNLDQQNNQR